MQLLLVAVIAVVAGFLQAITGVFAAFFLDPTNFNSPLEQAIGLGAIYLSYSIYLRCDCISGIQNSSLRLGLDRSA